MTAFSASMVHDKAFAPVQLPSRIPRLMQRAIRL